MEKRNRRNVKNNKNIRSVVAVIIMSSIIIYAGLLLFRGYFAGSGRKGQDSGSGRQNSSMDTSPELRSGTTEAFPVSYTHLAKTINGAKQEMDILEVRLDSGKARIFPILSHDMLFGFEKLSSMVQRTGAYAAVNSGFYYEYGEPAGMVALNGQIITNPAGAFPVFLSGSRGARLEQLEMQYWLESGQTRLQLSKINNYGAPGEAVLYTPLYGRTNRAKASNVAVSIKNGSITSVGTFQGECDIPPEGMLLTFYEPYKYTADTLPFKKGDAIKLVTEPSLEDGANAYQCGSWILRNGELVVPDRDDWIGVLTNRDPRTVIGIKDKSTVILLTVDGRQPGYSEGLTGKELGSLLLGLGVKDAAMLDGGASSEMIVNGKMVNRPSFKGQERPLGGALAVGLE